MYVLPRTTFNYMGREIYDDASQCHLIGVNN
jgi:hypothetical protein